MGNRKDVNLQVLAALQDALLGKVHGSFRSVGVGVNHAQKSLTVIIVHEKKLSAEEEGSIEEIEEELEAELGDRLSVQVMARQVDPPKWFSWPAEGAEWFPVYGRYEEPDSISAEEVQL